MAEAQNVAPGQPGQGQPDQEEEAELSELLGQELTRIVPFTARLQKFLYEMGAVVFMLGRASTHVFSRRFDLYEVAYQIEVLGTRSLSIALLVSVFAGFVLALQFAHFMAMFGIQHTVGKVVIITLFRELGPVLTALTVGARVGSGITAELGSMKVTEQIDAIRVLGADPIRRLVMPRVLACLILMPALTALADVCGLTAGSIVVYVQYDIPIDQYFSSAIQTVDLMDFLQGIIKAAVFGIIISAVGCYKGFAVEGGTEGVGTATTETVAITSVTVCLSDFFLTKLILAL